MSLFSFISDQFNLPTEFLYKLWVPKMRLYITPPGENHTDKTSSSHFSSSNPSADSWNSPHEASPSKEIRGLDPTPISCPQKRVHRALSPGLEIRARRHLLIPCLLIATTSLLQAQAADSHRQPLPRIRLHTEAQLLRQA
jgi:hypothetical protein